MHEYIYTQQLCVPATNIPVWTSSFSGLETTAQVQADRSSPRADQSWKVPAEAGRNRRTFARRHHQAPIVGCGVQVHYNWGDILDRRYYELTI